MPRDKPYTPDSIATAIGLESLAIAPDSAERAMRILFAPSFHPECALTALEQDAQTRVVLNTAQTNLWYWRSFQEGGGAHLGEPAQEEPPPPDVWEEACSADEISSRRFWAELSAIGPAGLGDGGGFGVDGMRAYYVYRDAAASTSFQAWSPRPPSPHFRLAAALWELADAALGDERSVRLLEQLHRYLGLGPPIKVQSGDPVRVRVFGGLSSQDRTALASALTRIPDDRSVVVDMTNCDGMGTLVRPVFAEFARRASPTVWAALPAVTEHLRAVGIPTERIATDRNAAEQLLAGRR